MSVDWPLVKLCEHAAFQEGYVNPTQKKPEYFDGPVKWLRAVDLNDGFVYQTSRTLSQQGFDSAGKSAKLFEPNTIAISKSGTIGRVGILKDYMCGNRAVINVKPHKTTLDTWFAFFILKHRRPDIELLATGSVQPNLYTSALGSLEFRLPPLHVQQWIAKILSSLDEKIDCNEKTNQTLEQMAQALFKSWFVDFDPVIDNAMESGFFDQLAAGDGIPEPLAARVTVRRAVREGMRQALRQTVAEGARAATGAAAASGEPTALNPSLPADIRALFPSSFVEHPELGWIPEGGAVKTLAELAEKISKGTTPNKTDLSQAKDEPTVRFLKVKDMGDDGEIDISNLELISRSIHEGGLKRSILQRGDLLFSIAGTIGRVGQVTEELHDSNTNQAVAFIRLKDAQSHQEFVRQNLLSPRIQSDVTAKVVQGVQANVSLKSIGELAVCVPSVELLNVWNSSVFPLIRQIELQRRQSSSLANLRDTLLPKLLSGELTLAEAGPEAD
jgi:type I restriction enzyme S subunit